MTMTSSTIHLPVRPADPTDATSVARVLTAAFFDDPVTDWLVPDRARRPIVLPPLFELFFEVFEPHGATSVSSDGAGVALWLPPACEMVAPDQLEAFARRTEEAAGADAARILELGEFFEAHAPDEPHWHLQLLGTLPERQGEGIGSALLEDGLARADRSGASVYLEATTPRSRMLYEHHGFGCRGEITLPDGPPLWQMWRTPR